MVYGRSESSGDLLNDHNFNSISESSAYNDFGQVTKPLKRLHRFSAHCPSFEAPCSAFHRVRGSLWCDDECCQSLIQSELLVLIKCCAPVVSITLNVSEGVSRSLNSTMLWFGILNSPRTKTYWIDWFSTKKKP